MNKDEMKKDLINILKNQCDNAPFDCCYGCDCDECRARTLINAGCRKVADDEIVIKKQQYEQLKKYNRDRKRLRLRWQQAKQAVKDTEKKTKQETARKILQDMCKIARETQWNLVGLSEIKAYAKRKYGIELED